MQVENENENELTKNDNGQEEKKENTLSTKKVRFKKNLVGFLVESVFSFLFLLSWFLL